MAQFIKQMWQCVKCTNVRQWGAAIAPDVLILPFLRCDVCARYTEHTFLRHIYERF